MPKFLNEYPDANILYMMRNPLSVIPSGLSLVTGVLDKKFGFWDKPKEDRNRFINNLYKGLVQLLLRFESDWSSGKIDRSKVLIVPFDKMMKDFNGLMEDIIKFTDYSYDDKLIKVINNIDVKQKTYISKHKYDLSKFGLTEEKIKKDCKPIYDTFFN